MIRGTLLSGATGVLVNRADANSAVTRDPVPDNNHAITNTAIITSADVYVTKLASSVPSPAVAGLRVWLLL